MSEENETSVEGSTTVEPIKDSKESTPVEKTVNTPAKKTAAKKTAAKKTAAKKTAAKKTATKKTATKKTATKKQATTRASKGKSSVKPAGVQDPNATPTRRRLPMVDGRARRAGIYQR